MNKHAKFGWRTFLLALSLASLIGAQGADSNQTNCVPTATGLAVWLPFDQSTTDVVSGSNAVLFGTPLYTAGRVGSALRLDGVDDAARAMARSGLDIGAGSGLTIEAWIRPENVQTPGALAEWSDNASLLGVHFYVASSTPGSLFANLIDTNGITHSFSSPSGLVATGQWQHVAVTYERSNGLARLFLNGTSVVEQVLGSFRPQTRPDLQIGRRVAGGANYHFRGGLDELSLYHHALSVDEIAQIAQAGSNGKCLTNTPPPPPQTNCVVAGLVSWWRGDGNANDAMGNNPGQLRNGAGFAPGMVGQGFNLNGSGQHILVPDSATLDLTNELTVELWFKADDFNGRPLFDKRNGSGPCNYGAILANGIGVELYYNDPTVADGDYPGSGFEISAHPSLPSAGVFHHFGSTFRQTGANSVELNYYLDGALVRSRTIAGNLAQAANGAPLSIGTEGAGAGAMFKGVIDEVSLYNRALSLAEMQFIHAAGSAGKCSTNTPPPPSQTNCVLAVAGLSAWLPLEGNAEDVIGGGLGILNGSPAFVAGKVAQGLRFDGQDDFVRLPASAATDIGAGSGVTIEMWINPQQLNSSAALVEWSPSTGSAVGLHLFAAQLSPGSLYANLIDTSGASHTFTSPSGVLSAGVFQHIALSYDRVSGLARFYVNGIQVASNNVGNLRLETRTDLRLGQRVLGGTPYRFTGVMDEVSLYNRALSQAELAAIYQAGEGGKCPNDLPTPPSQVRVVSVAAPSGGIASVPVQVNARGDENALGFSLEFNSSVLTFHSAAPALGLPPGATLIVNTNEAVAGRVGIILALAANSALPAGTQEVVRIAFQTVVTLNAVTTPVNFGGAPVAMQVSDALARPVPANYLNGNVVVAEGEFEADTAPRPGGDRMLAVIDWVQLGRFVVGADAVLSNEFQRADCAPRDSKGNGVISTADFVQAGRFVAGLDPLTASGGPVVPSGGAGGFQPAGAPACTVSALNTTTVATGSFTVPIRVNAHGTENALGLSIVFDPTKMTLAGVVLGADAMSGSLNLNTAHQASGKVGVLLALPSGQTLNVGVNEVLQLNFVAANAAIGNSLVSFGDEPVLREAVNANADVIPSTFVAGTVTFVPVVPPGPPITYNRDGAILYLSWPASATGFELEGATAFGAPWTTISESFTLGGQKIAIVPATGSQRFFRLRKP